MEMNKLLKARYHWHCFRADRLFDEVRKLIYLRLDQ